MKNEICGICPLTLENGEHHVNRKGHTLADIKRLRPEWVPIYRVLKAGNPYEMAAAGKSLR